MQPIIFRQSSHISFNNSHALLSHIIICRINRGWYTELYIRRKAVFKWKYIWRTPFPRVVRVFWYISSDIIEYLVIRPNSLHILILRTEHTNPNYSVHHTSSSIPLPCHMIWYDMIWFGDHAKIPFLTALGMLLEAHLYDLGLKTQTEPRHNNIWWLSCGGSWLCLVHGVVAWFSNIRITPR